jgi:hypothetical protein
MKGKMFRALLLVIAGVMIGLGAPARAGDLLVAGAPGYNAITGTGFWDEDVYSVLPWAANSFMPGVHVNNSGTVVGWSDKYVNGSETGLRAVRFDGSGTAATELDGLGTDFAGSASSQANAINDTGMAVGYAQKYDINGSSEGYRAVRWDASGTAATELGDLGTDGNGSTSGTAFAVNDAGTAVGYLYAYVSGHSIGTRAVRWDASGITATELGNLGTDIGGLTYAGAYAMNASGTAVGYSYKYVNSSRKGSRAVRWDGPGTTATELGNLGTSSGGVTNACAYAVNAAGTAVGYCYKYNGGINMGTRAVRWDASGAAVTELGSLGTSSAGAASACAFAVNSAGTAVGYSQKFDASGRDEGHRAVRWDASRTAPTELANLGTYSDGYTETMAYAVNSAGTAVGYASRYSEGDYRGEAAVIWLPDGSVIDLNSLGVTPVPAGGSWWLVTARAISDDGWVEGDGFFEPGATGDGSQPLDYGRLWVVQVGLGGAWTNAAGGTWGRGPNWSTGTPAMQVGNAMFNLNSAYTVALDRDELTKTITISAGTVTLSCNGHTLSTESGLSIANGATLTASGTIASDILNAGTLQLSGSGTIGNVANSAIVEAVEGNHICGNVTGTGSMLVDAGAALTATSVMQNTITLGAGATLTIAALSGGPSAAGTAISPVPEPSTMAMLALAAAVLGVCGLGRCLRRVKSAVI